MSLQPASVRPTQSVSASSSNAEAEKEIAREFSIAAMQADLLRQQLEHLYDRLGVVMRPDEPQKTSDSERPMPGTELGQRINSLTLEFQRAGNVVGSILQRLELQ